MDNVTTGWLLIILVVLIGVSAFFSGSETSMMAINRYRLRHKVRSGNKTAKRVQYLLDKPERLLGAILIGNTFANILAAAIATVLAVRLWGELGLALATGILTIIILIFAEVTPKTVAALHPERMAFAVSLPLKIILILLYPIVWLVNSLVNGYLRWLRLDQPSSGTLPLTQEELRTVVLESNVSLSVRNQTMLLRLLGLREVTVEDVMVPRNEVLGIDILADWEQTLLLLRTSQHTKLPLYKDTMDNVLGIVHLRQVLQLLLSDGFGQQELTQVAEEPYYVPEGTSLSTQLVNFQQNKRRMALVVDEYGDIQGLVTLENILEEIVGEFNIDKPSIVQDVYPQDDGSYLVDGSANIRELVRDMGWALPQDGAKTLNGLIIEYLEMIPDAGVCMRINGYPIEVMIIKENRVKTARIIPALRNVLKEQEMD